MYQVEEGIDTLKILSSVHKEFTLDKQSEQLINDIRTRDAYWDEFSSEKHALLNHNKDNLTENDVKAIKKMLLKNKSAAIKQHNRMSRMFLEKSYLKFHIWLHFIFYIIVVSIPIVSVVDCRLGVSVISYFCIGAFLICVLIMDTINMKQYFDM